ncbi:MAG: hypothetical protein RL264_1448 [Bacteroidota bacterium]|jgi:3-phosphoshikimate 1-carboxyvinyltransferase
MSKIISPFNFSGNATVPPSKSYGQRALILSLFCDEMVRISNLGESDDEQALLRLLPHIGKKISFENGDVLIEKGSSFPENTEINVGESGTALRMLGVIAPFFAKEVILNGKGTLLQRKQGQLITFLEAAGCQVEHQNELLPIRIYGGIQQIPKQINGSESSQVISGVAYLLPFINTESKIKIAQLKSKPYLEMTVDFLRSFQLDVNFDGLELKGRGNQRLSSFTYTVENDWSGAANLLIGAALSGEITILGLNPNSLQADKKILGVLSDFGAKIKWSMNSISVQKNQALPFQFDGTDCPDLLPIVAVLACGASGKSTLKGMSRLQNKESNRALAICSFLEIFGVHFKLTTDQLQIYGTGKVKGGNVQCFNDHRIVIATTIAACISQQAISIDTPSAVSKSFPRFFEIVNH